MRHGVVSGKSGVAVRIHVTFYFQSLFHHRRLIDLPDYVASHSQSSAVVLSCGSILWWSAQSLCALPSDLGVDLVGSGWLTQATFAGRPGAYIILSTATRDIDGSGVCRVPVRSDWGIFREWQVGLTLLDDIGRGLFLEHVLAGAKPNDLALLHRWRLMTS